MNKFFRVTFILIGILILTGAAAYLLWFYNPNEHTLQFDPSSIYESDSHYAITNANIVDVELGKILKNWHLLIRDGVIKQIISGTLPENLPKTYTVIDAKNKFIMPALIDMHVHLNSGGLIPPEEVTRTVALEQLARYGVGTIFTLGGQGFGQDQTADLIKKQKEKLVVAPQIFSTGDILTTPGGYPIPLVSMMTGQPEDEINLEEEGIITVTEETDLDAILQTKKELGFHGVKVMMESGFSGSPKGPRLSNRLVQKIVEKATDYDLPVFAHVSREDDLEDAINIGVDVIVHSIGDQVLTDAQPLLEQMKADSIFYIPTLSIANMYQNVENPTLLEDPFQLRYASEKTNRSLENWPLRKLMLGSAGMDVTEHRNNMLRNFTTFYEAGVPVIVGSDAGNPTVIPGYSTHKELEYMAQQGMPNDEILRSATIKPARFLSVDNEQGSIKEGKKANLIILEANPLEDVTNTQTLSQVMLEGYWIK